MPKKMVAEKIYLPKTLEEFDALVDKIAKKYKFTDKKHVAAIVATRITHMPVDQAKTTLEYLGDCVHKSIAYHVANHKGQMIQHEVHVDELEALLKANPLDQQALDSLRKASDEGSPYAKKVLDKYSPTEPPTLSVVS